MSIISKKRIQGFKGPRIRGNLTHDVMVSKTHLSNFEGNVDDLVKSLKIGHSGESRNPALSKSNRLRFLSAYRRISRGDEVGVRASFFNSSMLNYKVFPFDILRFEFVSPLSLDPLDS